mgnify:CR=1 FL=1
MPLILLIFLLILTPARIPQALAQKLILYTDNDSYGRMNQEKTWIIGYGEPAYANFFDTRVPARFFLKTPEGKDEKLTLLRRELFDPWFNQKRIAFETKITPKVKGDFLLCIEGEDTLAGRGILLKDYAKALFHVEKEGPWDSMCAFELEIRPFTRPYGLQRGALFWGQVLYQGEPVVNGTIEAERLRLKLNPQALPLDSTREVNYPIFKKQTRLDDRGYFFVNFEEEGWWVLSVSLPRGTKAYGNQRYPYELRSHLWLYVYSQGGTERKGPLKTPSKKKKTIKKTEGVKKP